jgi:alpha-1,3-mannosyltransferase
VGCFNRLTVALKGNAIAFLEGLPLTGSVGNMIHSKTTVALLLILAFNSGLLLYWREARLDNATVQHISGSPGAQGGETDRIIFGGDLDAGATLVEDSAGPDTSTVASTPSEDFTYNAPASVADTEDGPTYEKAGETDRSDSVLLDPGSSIDTDAAAAVPHEQQILATAAGIVQSVAAPGTAQHGEMLCPTEHALGSRYEVLKLITETSQRKGIHYLFALNLYQAANVIQRLLISIIEAAEYLGPENCAVSIVEGRSTDGTWQVLEGIEVIMESRKIKYFLQTSDIAPLADEGRHRVRRLARLRNMALAPLTDDEDGLFAASAKVIFINDVVLCPDDILELLYQHNLQGAVQTCAMDYIKEGQDFYDVWVSRTMTGDTFWPVVIEAPFRDVQDLFWDDPSTRGKYDRRQPFQVFSCWGGMTVIEGFPFVAGMLQFRGNAPGECFGGEPQLLATDLFRLGLPYIQTVPAVAVGYENEHTGYQVKQRQGFVHERVPTNMTISNFSNDYSTERIVWLPPPTKFRCMPEIGLNITTDTIFDLSTLLHPS